MDTTNTIVGLLDKEISELHMLTMAAWDAFDAIKSPLENELQYIAKTAHTAWQDGNLVAADCVRERLLYMAKQNVHTCTLPIDHFTEGTYYKAFDVGRWVTSYLQIRNTITDTTQKNVLQQWFKNLLDCQEDFTQQLLHQSNQLKEPIWNGIYSAMRVSALLGVALESREILLQAVDTLVLVMGSIQDTGTMRNEIETKKESALFYHNSMANDTMAIVAIAEYNEIELLDDENIYTFLTTVVDNLDDGALFESLTGHKQTREISIGTLFWVRYYLDVIDGNKKSALPQYIQNFIQTIDRAYMTREFWY
ncbi:MAG: hypothetical protein DWG76_05285 [Chloroflexi bacterium]|nr:hypothetical protein [Chloroflexota bacterium]